MTVTSQKHQRKIVHIDFDAFYASIEVRDDPSLVGLPVAVGGMIDKRGVIATCNYEARSFGVRSAMASAYAMRICPDLLIIPPRFYVYKKVSKLAHNIFNSYTKLVEPLSLDEAYLDVSESTRCQGSATLIAREIKSKIYKATGVTASAGVAPNKFLAKIASDWNKPDGLFVITPDQVEDFVFALPVSQILGVGKVTAEKLYRKGIDNCGALRQYSRIKLIEWFGSFGGRLWELARGIDDRPVDNGKRQKSLSVEQTYNNDLISKATVISKVEALLGDLILRYESIKSEYIIVRHFVKIKFNDFTQTTLEERVDWKQHLSLEHFSELMVRAWERSRIPVRLLGLGVRLLDTIEPSRFGQLELWPLIIQPK